MLFRQFENFPRQLVHPKVWGYEVWFFNTEQLCMKLLVIYPGYTCSDHTHDRKYEIFVALDSSDEGRVHISVDGIDRPLSQGEHVVIDRGTVHSFHVRGTQPGSLLEFSTNHREDDSYRVTVSRLLALGGEQMGDLGELGCFRGVKVLQIGDLMYDRYENGQSTRLSPEAPVPVVLNPDESSQPGGLGNVACNTLSLGGESILVGAIGDDHHGEALTKMLSDAGACIDYIVRIPGRRTTTKTRIMTGGHHHCRVDKEDSDDITGDAAQELIDRIQQAIVNEKPRVLYFADYDKGVLAPDIIQAAISAAQEAGIATIADPKLKHPWAFKTVDVYKPNIKRFGQILETEILTESDLQEAVNDFQPHMAVHDILVTRGPHGMSLYRGTELVKHIPARLVEVSELSGAGDTVGAVLSLGVGGGLSVQRSAEIANVAASLVVSKVGTATCTPFELAEALEEAGDLA